LALPHHGSDLNSGAAFSALCPNAALVAHVKAKRGKHPGPKVTIAADKRLVLVTDDDRTAARMTFSGWCRKAVMRIIGALPVGLAHMKWSVFTVLNASSVLLWTGLFVGAGYYFGAAIERAVVDGWGDFSIVLLLVFLGLGFLGWRRLSQTVD
jgi:hypothetical protein